MTRTAVAAGLLSVSANASATLITDNTTVRIATTLGDIDVTFYDQTTPLSVDNFFDYIDAGLLIDTFFHRSIPGFVVQGGGFVWPDGGSLGVVNTFDPVLNEPGISNTRGTIAYAKQENNPNSATSGFFFNLEDNSANLDFQNDGFTVFARVVGSGMDVVDAIAALPRANAGGAFTTLPINGEIENNTIQRENVVLIESITTLEVLAGDFNNNGSVEQGDLNLVLNNWGQTASALPVGLYGFGPGAVDQTALNLVLNNWGAAAAPQPTTDTLPEPGITGFFAIGLGVLLKRGRR
ncbi:MAG: peptidylprolyl isomerase [Planctomycetota bacterium]